MDNALPIPFLDDPDRPELSYQLGFSLSRKVTKQIDEFEPTLVHITVPDCTTLHIIQYARKKELPIMGTYHSNIPEYMEHYPGLSWLKPILGSFFRHQYNFMQTLYVPTPFIVRFLVDNYQMNRVTNMKVWGRGVDVNTFNPSFRSMEYRRSLGVDDGTPIVLWVGRLVPEKRPDIFRKVIRRLHGRGLKFHALVVGAGPCEAAIKALPNTTFAGWLGEKQLSRAYASSDIFLFPSAVETFGNVTLEAAASGLPVIVESGCSGHLVHDGVNGFAAAAGDEEAFFENTMALVEDANMRQEFSASSRELALTLEKQLVVRQMLDNYVQDTEEFYVEYGGRHRNRDSVYTQPGSFRGGKYPRPTALILCEWVFISLFMVLWKVGDAMVWFQGKIRPLSAPNGEKLVEQKPMSNDPDSRIPPVPSDSRRAKVSVVGMDDVEIGDSTTTTLTTSDDTTDTTGSTGSDHPIPTAPNQSLGDYSIFHFLANAFAEVAMFQGRIECRIGDLINSWCCPSQTEPFRGKRKNSDSGFSTEGEKRRNVSHTVRSSNDRHASSSGGKVSRRNLD